MKNLKVRLISLYNLDIDDKVKVPDATRFGQHLNVSNGQVDHSVIDSWSK